MAPQRGSGSTQPTAPADAELYPSAAEETHLLLLREHQPGSSVLFFSEKGLPAEAGKLNF